MAKKKTTAAGKSDEKPEPGEQLDLLDVDPENAKALKRIGRQYKKAMAARMSAASDEADCKEKLLLAVHDAKIQAKAGEPYRFRVDGMVISVTPREELVQIKFDNPDDEAAED